MAEIQEYLESVRHRLIHDEGFMPAEADLPLALQHYTAAYLTQQAWGRIWHVALVPTPSLPPEQLSEVLSLLQSHLTNDYPGGPPRRGLVVLVSDGPLPPLKQSGLVIWRVDLAAATVSRDGAPAGAPTLSALNRFDPVDWAASTAAQSLPADTPPAEDPGTRSQLSGAPWRDTRWRHPLFTGPWVTNLMQAAIWAIFVLMLVQSGFIDVLSGFSGATLVHWGSQYGPAIIRGQWWRLGTAMFLHGSIMHIGFNSYALYVLGPALENLFGHGRFLLIYLGAGILASTSSLLMGTQNAIGASGAIFGLMGAYIYYAWYVPGPTRRRLWAGIWPTLLINLVIGVTLPFIDNWAHLGGLLGGFTLSALLGLPHEQLVTIRRVAGVALLALYLWWAAPTLIHLWALSHSGLL